MIKLIPDNLLVNLKILSKIQKNGRISRSYDGVISLEQEVVYQPLKRFLQCNSRKQAVFEINSIINECIEIINHILNSKHTNKNFCNTEEYIKNCELLGLLIKEIKNAKVGIENLKFTYQTDLNITSQLDIIILKVNSTIKDTTNKLLYFQSFINSASYELFNPNEHTHHEMQQSTSTVEYDINMVNINEMKNTQSNQINNYNSSNSSNFDSNV
jgi:hypothetical protein